MNYNDKQLIAYGGFGKIYKIPNNKSSKWYAVKEIDINSVIEKYLKESPHQQRKYTVDLSIRDKIYHSLINEALIMKQLNHINIVKLINYNIIKNNDKDSSEKLCITMEYSSFGSLYQLIKSFKPQNGIPEFITCGITCQLLDGINYLSNKSIIHGDIKASNILIFNNGIIKICDFGLSFQWDDQNNDDYNDDHNRNNNKRLQKIVMNGSAYWLAPEIILHKMASPKSDIWSLGATIIEMLTGIPPFGNFNPLIACHKVGIGEKINYPINISNNCKEFLNMCFEIQPTIRARAKTLLNTKWILSGNRKVLQYVDGLYDNDEKEEGEEDVINNDKRTILEEFKEKDDSFSDWIDDDFSSLSLTTKNIYETIDSITLDELKKLTIARKPVDIQSLHKDNKFTVHFIHTIETQNIKRCVELFRIGQEYLRKYPTELETICLKGFLFLISCSNRDKTVPYTFIEEVIAVVVDTLGTKGSEWLSIVGIT